MNTSNPIVLKPYMFAFRLTERCEVGCNHCSVSAVKKGGDHEPQTLMAAMDEIAEIGIGRLHLTGGEPLLFDAIATVVEGARARGLVVGMTSSTFTRTNENTIPILEAMAAAGVNYVMLSHDDQHARRVDLAKFCDFVERSCELGLDVVVFTTESPQSAVTSAVVRGECEIRGVPIEEIFWGATDMTYVGRAARLDSSGEIENADRQYPRCPIVLSAPTLNPDGSVSLCNCSRFKAPKFTIGHYPDQSISTIVTRMVQDPVYRLLAKHGPQQLLASEGEDVPDDMCSACERYLLKCERTEFLDRILARAAEEELEVIEVDYEGLPDIYKRYLDVHGERSVS